MERASDTVMPRVYQHRRFRPFVEDKLKDLCAGWPRWGPPCHHHDTPPGAAVVMTGTGERFCSF